MIGIGTLGLKFPGDFGSRKFSRDQNRSVPSRHLVQGFPVEIIKLRRFKRAVASTAFRFNADAKRTALGPVFRDRLG